MYQHTFATAIFRAAQAVEALRHAIDLQDHHVADVAASRLRTELATVAHLRQHLTDDETTALATDLVARVHSTLAAQLRDYPSLLALLERL
jgi:hypothetical protein